MAIYDVGGEAWVILHDSLQSVVTVNDAANSPFAQMSYEFASWITGWDRGVTGRDEHQKRNFAIATRKSCYAGPLMTELGMFTKDGLLVLERAKSYMIALRRHYESFGVTGDDVPSWDNVDDMERIVLAGQITAKQIAMLRNLYVKVNGYDETFQTKFSLALPTDVDDIYREVDGITYLMTATFRTYTKVRLQFEQLVKYGLLELHILPKLPEHEGRGRAPIGARFTEQGIKFYEDFLNRYDPTRVKTAEFERMRQEMMGN